MKSIINFIYLPCDFTAKRKPPSLEVAYNIYKKINSKAMPLKAFWLEKTTCFAGGLLHKPS